MANPAKLIHVKPAPGVPWANERSGSAGQMAMASGRERRLKYVAPESERTSAVSFPEYPDPEVLRKTLAPQRTIGGLSDVAASRSQYTEDQWHLRASVRLRTQVHRTARGTYNRADRKALDAAIKASLTGTQLRLSKIEEGFVTLKVVPDTLFLTNKIRGLQDTIEERAKAAGAAEDVDPEAASLLDNMSKCFTHDYLKDVSDTGNFVGEVVSAFGDVVAGEAIETTAHSVLAAVPGLGPVFNVIKLVKTAVTSGMDLYALYDIASLQGRSIGAAADQVLWAAGHYKALDNADNVTKLAGGVLKFGTSFVPIAGPITAVVVGLGGVMKETMKLIHDRASVDAINKKLREPDQISAKLLDDRPQLALYLPFLDPIDAFVLLGVMPAGWMNQPDTTEHKAFTKLISSPSNDGLQARLQQAITGLDSGHKLDGPWAEDIMFVRQVIDASNSALEKHHFHLYRGDTSIHDIGFGVEGKLQRAKRLFQKYARPKEATGIGGSREQKPWDHVELTDVEGDGDT